MSTLQILKDGLVTAAELAALLFISLASAVEAVAVPKAQQVRARSLHSSTMLLDVRLLGALVDVRVLQTVRYDGDAVLDLASALPDADTPLDALRIHRSASSFTLAGAEFGEEPDVIQGHVQLAADEAIADALQLDPEDPAMRAVKHNVIADRAEPYRLRIAPAGVLAITAGVDTQDNRLAVHLTGWGRGMAAWTLDYIELPGDPADDAVWCALVDLLNKPVECHNGALLTVEAVAIDAGGHRTEAVKAFVRSRRVRRPMAIFGAVPNNAPVLSKGKLQDINWRGQMDKRGVLIHHVGTVGIKHLLFSRLSTDADKQSDVRLVHFSDELPPEYFAGLVSETYNPVKNRFYKRRGARNEPLDTCVYAYAAAHHPELRLHRYSKADWEVRETRLTTVDRAAPSDSRETSQGTSPQSQAQPPAVTKPAADSAEHLSASRLPEAVVSRHTTRRKARIDQLADELTVGAALRLRCDSDDIHDVVRAVVDYLIAEYPAQELYIPSGVSYPVEQLRADVLAGKSVRAICKQHRIDRRTLYRLIGE